MLSWKRLDTRVVMQVLEGLAMGRDVQECPANGDAQLYGSPDELPLPDAADTSRLPNAGHIKNKRSSQHETYVQPLKKPSLAAPVPVAPGTVVAHVQATPVALPSGLKAHSSTCEPRPRDSLSVGVANPTVASKPIEPTLAQAVSQLAQSLKDPQLQMLADKSHPPCATAAALPGTHKQVAQQPPSGATAQATGPLARSLPFQSTKTAANGVSPHIQTYCSPHAPPVNHSRNRTPGPGTGPVPPFSNVIAPKPLLNAPTPVPPRPPLRRPGGTAIRPTLSIAQLASTALSHAATPPTTTAAPPRQPPERGPLGLRRHTSGAVPPQAPAATTAATNPYQGTSPLRAARPQSAVPGQPQAGPKTKPGEEPKSSALTHKLAQVYAGVCGSSAPRPQLKTQVTGSASRPALQSHLSIDVVVPPATSAAPPIAATSVPKTQPTQAPALALAEVARAALSRQGVDVGSPALAGLKTLDLRPPPYPDGTSRAVDGTPAHGSSAAVQVPVPGAAAVGPAAALASALSQPLLRGVSDPLRLGAMMSQLQRVGSAPPASVRPSSAAVPPSPLTGSAVGRGRNPAAAIAAAATATAGKHVHPKLNFGSSASLASLVKQLNERPGTVLPSAVQAAQAASAAATDPRRKPSLQSQGVGAAGAPGVPLQQPVVANAVVAPAPAPAATTTSACSAGEPGAPSATNSSRLTPSAVTLQHLVDAGVIAAGAVLRCTLPTGQNSGQDVTLNADGTVQVKDGIACTLADLVGVSNGKIVEAEEEAWRHVEYDGRPLEQYRRRYIASLGAAPDHPPKRKSPESAPELPFVWSFFDELAKRKQADDAADVDALGEDTHEGQGKEEEDQEEDVAAAPSPPRKRARRQGTTVVSYAKLATEGVQEGKDGSKSAARHSRQGLKGSAGDSSEAGALGNPTEHAVSKSLDISLLQGVARFAHLQPRSPAAAPPAPTPLPSKRMEPPLKRPASSVKPPAASPAHANHGVCPAAAAAAAAAAAGVGQLQPLDKMTKLPPMPRKLKTFNAALPNAPKPAASTTAASAPQVDAAQRSRRERAPARTHGVSGLTHTMMQLEAYTRPAGDPGADAQPFSIEVHPVVLAAMDIHAHLCQNEIIGVLGGRYDAQKLRLVVLKSLSVQEGVLDVGKTDVEMDPADQSRAIEELRQQGLQCVGWYHSHPTFPVWPSAIDVYNQQIQQVARSHQATNGCATPYIAAIVGPYDQKNASAQCSMSWFYVENKRSAEFSLDADPEVCLQHMVPKALSTALIEDAKLPVSHITQCAAELIQRYAGYSSRTELRSFWRGDMSCLQKLVSSVFHSVRGFLDTDALKEVGTSITSSALQHFYGVDPSSLQANPGKKPTARSGRGVALETG